MRENKLTLSYIEASKLDLLERASKMTPLQACAFLYFTWDETFKKWEQGTAFADSVVAASEAFDAALDWHRQGDRP